MQPLALLNASRDFGTMDEPSFVVMDMVAAHTGWQGLGAYMGDQLRQRDGEDAVAQLFPHKQAEHLK